MSISIRSKSLAIMVLIIVLICLFIGNLFNVSAGAAKKVVAYMLPNVGPVYTDRWNAAKIEADKLNIDLILYNAGGYANINKQITQVENLIERRVDGIIIHACSSTALTEVLDRAYSQGIKVVLEYVPVKSEKSEFPLVRLDAYWQGRICAAFLVDQMKGKGEIIALPGPPGQEEAAERWQGFTDYVSMFPKIKIVGEEWTVADIATAIRASENLLTAHPKASGIYTWYDLMSQGMVSAMKARKMKPIPHVTCDLSVECEKLMREGWITGTEPGAPLATARATVQVINKMINGESVPAKTDIPPMLLTKDLLDGFDRRNIEVSK